MKLVIALPVAANVLVAITISSFTCLQICQPANASAKPTGQKGAHASKKPAVDEKIPEVSTQTREGFDVDPRILAREYGKQANAYYALAQKREKAGKIDEAQRFYFKALAIRERIWGSSDPATAAVVFKIADIHLKKGNLEAADACFKHELSLISKHNGPGSYEMVVPLKKLAAIAMKQKRFDDAYDYCCRIVPLEARKSGEESSETVAARLNLIDAAIAVHDWQEAEKNLKESEKIALSKNDDHSKDYLRICQDYATVLKELNRPSEADSYASKATALRSEIGSTSSKQAPVNASDNKGLEKKEASSKEATSNTSNAEASLKAEKKNKVEQGQASASQK